MGNDTFIVQDELEIHPAALIMPPMGEGEFEEFKEDLLGNGLIEPIILFQDKVLDGRNRYLACRELNIEIFAQNWEGGMDPVEYVVSKNIHRRQLTTGQRAMAAERALNFYAKEAKERQREAGQEYGRGKEKVPEPMREPIAKHEREATSKAGEMFDVSGRSVSSAKYVREHGTEEEAKAVETGKAPLKTVEKQVRERVQNAPKKDYKPQFNQTNDNIKWAKWTWNPVTGCEHGCAYCYARDIAKRFYDHGFEPHFYPERLDAPQNTKLPIRTDQGWTNVFVSSMGDLFGDWVPQDWIDQVMSAVRDAQQWNFIFLTKNPERLIDIEWPVNAIVGTTVDKQERVGPAIKAFADMKYKPLGIFLSCEPLLERLDFYGNIELFDWVIIGGLSKSSGGPAWQPPFEWVESLHNQARKAGCNVFWKDNLTCKPQEYPEWLKNV